LHPAEKLRILLLSAMTTRMKSRYINSKKQRRVLIPIRGLLNLGIVQMGTTKVKALDPKAEGKSE
jgi:hypothetical protein